MKWYNTKWGGKLIATAMTGLMILALATPIVWWNYMQRYTNNSDGTATKGIMFQKTIYLREYKHLGQGNGIFGEYDRYSRSDRHDMVLTIYGD